VEIIKRGSTEFKDVKKILTEFRDKPTRKKLIRLYALKPSEDLDKKILLNNVQKDSQFIYDMNYSSILDHFEDRSHKLYREGKKPFYYFKFSAKSDWIKLPFEFTGKLKKKLFPLRIVK
jgi:hypothetical protein